MAERTIPHALAAALAAVLLACGPGDPPTPGDPGTGQPDGGGTGGGDAGGGDAGGGEGKPAGGGSGAGSTAWIDVIGGAGVEHVQDLAAVGGGGVVALTAIGIDGDRVHQLGLVRIDANGEEPWARALDVSARIELPTGALAAAPQGHLLLALGCPRGCGDLGAEVMGTALLRLTDRGEPQWIAALPGAPASNVVADAGGNAVLATREGAGTTIRSLGADAAVRWERAAPGGPVALAADGQGGVLVASSGSVVALDAAGGERWTRDLGDGVRVAAIGVAGGAVLVAGSSPAGVRGADVAPGPFLAVLEADGRVRAARALRPGGPLLSASVAGAALVTGADCAAEVVALDGDGQERWSRRAALASCGGKDVSVHAVEVTESGAIAIGGALRGDADLGAGIAQPEATDGFVAALRP